MWSWKKEKDEEPEGVSPGLERVMKLFSPPQQELLRMLCSDEIGQSHLFRNWPVADDPSDVSPAVKRQFVQQLETLDHAYPGGLLTYVKNARALLEKSRQGINPLEGWTPSVPKGQTFELGTPAYEDMETIGRHELGSVGFVLVAGGLGERLGYSNIKIGLPMELATGTRYVQYYIEYILAVQDRYADDEVKLPLCIMTSADTNSGTIQMLEENNYFGMDKEQVTIVQQGGGVPALIDNRARIAVDPHNPYKVMTKPHGHGDIHSLLYQHEVVKTWVADGIKWITFFQDTNGLAFFTLPLALGVSVEYNLIMNSLAIPRKAKQAVGAITKLTNSETDDTRTINVEYNQLDPLLRSTGSPDGDVNDPKTGFSPYPGNINQLLFKAEEYVEVLERTSGIMPEFVNPKYKDEEKTQFKKPTRLECMMQDFPTVLEGSETERVGFTSVPAEMCFSPVKNATADGVKLQQKGTPAGVAATGEADQYNIHRMILKAIGVDIHDGEEEEYNGIKFVAKPEIVIKPSAMLCVAEYKDVFPTPSEVHIGKDSSLIIEGKGKLTIKSMVLEGALRINCEDGADALVENLWIKNEGWERVAASEDAGEVIAMRGYELKKQDTSDLVYQKQSGCVIS